jgi:peptide subunit release factor 1 (eRF1)
MEEAFTLAAKGSAGVTGLIDTLNAIHEGRVKTLLVSEDYEQTGYRCTGCGYLTIQKLDHCPFCNGKFMTIEAAVDLAVLEALHNNADVKVIRQNEKLEQAGHIAAILRY